MNVYAKAAQHIETAFSTKQAGGNIFRKLLIYFMLLFLVVVVGSLLKFKTNASILSEGNLQKQVMTMVSNSITNEPAIQPANAT